MTRGIDRRRAHSIISFQPNGGGAVRTQRDASVFFVPLVARTGRPPLGPRMGRAPLTPDAHDRHPYKRSLVDNARRYRKGVACYAPTRHRLRESKQPNGGGSVGALHATPSPQGAWESVSCTDATRCVRFFLCRLSPARAVRPWDLAPPRL